MSRPTIQLHEEVMAEARGRPVVLAVSGGGDSMALLQIFWRLHRAGKLHPQLIVAHLNHQQRQPFADQAEALVHAQSAKRSLPLISRRYDTLVPSIHTPAGESTEAWLAVHRHSYLASVARELSPDAMILTGHQADDHAESLLLGLMRGSTIAGLAYPVIQHWDGVPVGAPLTYCRRTDLRTYLERQGVPCLEDPMNSDPHSVRSTVRMLLSELESRTGRDWTAPIARSAESIRQGATELQATAEGLYARLTVGGALDVRLWRQSPPIQAALALGMCGEVLPDPLTGRETQELARWLRTSPLRQGQFQISAAKSAQILDGKLRLEWLGPEAAN